MHQLSRDDAERQIRQLQARIAHQQLVAAQLSRHGFKGAAAQALLLAATLQSRIRQTAAGLDDAA